MHSNWRAQLERDGYTLIRDVFTNSEIRELIEQLTTALNGAQPISDAVRSREGSIYASRNLLQLFPEVKEIVKRDRLRHLLTQTLGTQCGLVRGLFFDKPPDQTWSLPWHKDLSIAIRENGCTSPLYSKARIKAGIPHVEAPRCVLESMLTLRIHLDRVTTENGPLLVIPGSHHLTEAEVDLGGATPIHANAGDVLAMRPLLSHSSSSSDPETKRHRRIIHLEFAAKRQLPDEFQWHDFQPVN